ncbi:hypothetical protein ST4_010 [Aeromonas phage ST4]|nr:hypothetical protein ST4_010 [Aeromonas phage ST4]
MDQQTAELIQAITAWHVNRMRNLQTIIDAPKDTDIKFQVGDQEVVFPAGSDLAKGFAAGVMLAKFQFEKLPFTFERDEPASKNGSTSETAKLLAAQLNGSQYPLLVSNELAEQAKAAGLVIVYGASDDLMEFRGAVYDELYVNDGGTALVDAEGLLPANADDLDTDEDRARYYYRKGKAKIIEALWAKEGDYSWTYRTAIPHETFEVVEDGQPYCRGIVFALADLGV